MEELFLLSDKAQIEFAPEQNPAIDGEVYEAPASDA